MKLIKRSIAAKSILAIVALLIIFSIIVTAIGYKGFTHALLLQYAEGAFRTADTASLIVDPDRMDDYLASGGETELYQEVWQKLDRLCNATGATFIYVIQPDLSDYGHITFLFSTMEKGSPYTMYEFGYIRETTNDEYREKYRALYENNSEREFLIRDKGYIETDPHITAMIPLTGSDGLTKGILCVQRQMDDLTVARNTYVKNVLLVLIILLLVTIVGMGMYLHSTLLLPVKKITEEASRFASENVTTGKKLTETIRNEDEIGVLAGSIDQMEEQIHNYVEELTQITAETERISTELSLATKIQADILPNTFPAFPDRPEFDIYATMDPAREVGGDFYDFFLVDEDHLCMVMADVSGKGIPAALFMMASRILLADNAMIGKSPAEILESTNIAVCDNNQEEMFVTVWLGILELSTGTLTAANAGHEYPVLKQPNGTFELIKDKHGFVIGGMTGMKYFEYTLQLEPGSNLFLYTDGVPEATDAEGKMFGIERMLSVLNQQPDATPERILANVRTAVDQFVKEAEQFDDLTMMSILYLGGDAQKRENK